jgi:hypothetical protein
MKKLLDCLRSERPLVAGALGRFADEFGLGRASVRIIGFLVLCAGPYLLGASYWTAWVYGILGYLAIAIIIRRRDRFWRHPDRRSTGRCRERRYFRVANPSDRKGEDPQVRSDSDVGPKPAGVSSQGATPKPAATGPETGQRLGEALLDLEQRLARLDQRIQRMESVVTDRAFDWDRRFRKG